MVMAAGGVRPTWRKQVRLDDVSHAPRSGAVSVFRVENEVALSELL